jgi:FKBP-type peptidyl-prolyl cis-trans isomerase SlyD
MAISSDCVVTIHYTLKDDDGAVIDSSTSSEPLSYLHGHGNIVPGLERELTGRDVGDKVSVRIPPAEGYGEYDKDLVQSVPRRTLRGVKDVQAGMHLHAQTEQGPRTLTVTRVAGDMVTLDANHPLAGKHLNFDIQIEGVRPATEEELSHGHVHGPDGHHH